MSYRRLFLGLAALMAGSAALAHSELVRSLPADNSEGAAPARVELHFSESLVTRSSAAKLVMTGMPGMAGHPPMAMAVSVSAGPDAQTMLITPKQPLPAGTYRVDYRAVSVDTHSVEGTVNFTVK